MSAVNTDNLLKLVPIRLRPITVPTREQVSGLTHDYLMGKFEEMYCMSRREEFKAAIKETLAGFVATKKDTPEGPLYDQALQKFDLGEKNTTDLMLAFLDRDQEDAPNE